MEKSLGNLMLFFFIFNFYYYFLSFFFSGSWSDEKIALKFILQDKNFLLLFHTLVGWLVGLCWLTAPPCNKNSSMPPSFAMDYELARLN